MIGKDYAILNKLREEKKNLMRKANKMREAERRKVDAEREMMQLRGEINKLKRETGKDIVSFARRELKGSKKTYDDPVVRARVQARRAKTKAKVMKGWKAFRSFANKYG